MIIGARLAQKLGIAPGGTITLIAPRGNVTPFGITPRIKTYTMAGTFKIGMSKYESTFIFMPLDEAQLYFNMGDDRQRPGSDGGRSRQDRTPWSARSHTPPALTRAGETWQDDQSEPSSRRSQVERNVMFLILTLIILVAALNIVSGLFMLVKDKSADIAILRTMGATRGAVMRVFLIAGVSIGVIGTFLGFVIGVVFCANIESIRQFLSAADRHDAVQSRDLFPQPHARRNGHRRR